MRSLITGLAAFALSVCSGASLAQESPKPLPASRPAAEERVPAQASWEIGVLLPPDSAEARTAKFAGKKIGEVLMNAMQAIRNVNDLPVAEQGPAMAEAADAYGWVAKQAAQQRDEAAKEARELREATAQLRKDHGPVLETQEELTKAGAQFEQQLETTRKRAEAARAQAARNPDDPTLQAIARSEFAALKGAEQAANQARQIMAASLAPGQLINAQLQMLDLRIRCRENDAALLNLASNSWAKNAKALRTLGDLTTRLADFASEPAVKVDWVESMIGQGSQLSPNAEREFQAWVAGDKDTQNN